MTLFPDYPRDYRGDIPAEMCFDVIRIFPEWGCAYLWDMNGVSSTVGDITGNDNDPWDDEFGAWQDIYESKPLTENADPVWESEQEKTDFEKAGFDLALRLFEFFDSKKTIIYYDTDHKPTRIDAIGKPPIRITNEE